MAYMSEAELEKLIDARVQRRLATDREYRNAENAEQQAEREEQITWQVERELGVWDGADADEERYFASGEADVRFGSSDDWGEE